MCIFCGDIVIKIASGINMLLRYIDVSGIVR